MQRGLQACGKVHAVADDGEAHAFFGADVARHDGIGVEPYADVHGRLTLIGSQPVPLHQLVDHGNRGAHRPIPVVAVRFGDAEHGHDGIADELVQHATLFLQAIHHQGEVFVQQRHDCRSC